MRSRAHAAAAGAARAVPRAAGFAPWLLLLLGATELSAQSWDATVTAAVAPSPAPVMAPLAPVLRRPIPVRQARGPALEAGNVSVSTPANLPPPAPKPPIWAAAGRVQANEAPAAGTPTGSLPEAAATTPRSNFVRQYCVNVADATADARYAWQKKTLADLEQELDKRMVLLEAKAAETRDWLLRRDEFSKKARDGLVLIYARMRPDAAAAQLAAMDEETAAAVINRLDPRNASGIMSEMDPAKAARLTAFIAGAARIPPNENAAAALKEKRS
jgi:flagellar motility protein MotE (MotC chaperone)